LSVRYPSTRQGYGWQAILNMANLIVVISQSKMYEK